MRDGDGPLAFVDTNVWLYAFIQSQDASKHATARTVLEQCEPILSTQVVNEVCVNLLRKASFSEERIGQLVEALYEKYQVISLDRSILLKATEVRRRHLFSFWDGVIVASALSSGASVLYSEDMQGGLVVEGQLTFVNPFAANVPNG
jgi:predicted nucleic acid-binding protein